MKCILENSFVFGLPTNLKTLIQILSDQDYLANRFFLGFQPKNSHLKEPLSEKEKQWMRQQSRQLQDKDNSSLFNPWFHHWP